MRRKASGKTIELPEPEERPSNVINLMDALKQSLKGSGAAKRSRIRRTRPSSHRRAAEEDASLARRGRGRRVRRLRSMQRR